MQEFIALGFGVLVGGIDGNFGVKQADPQAPLHVGGNAFVDMGSGVAGYSFPYGGTQAAVNFKTGSGAEAYIQFMTMNSDGVFAERARIKPSGSLRFVPKSSDPTGAEAGEVYYNSSTNKLRVYTGSAWVDLH